MRLLLGLLFLLIAQLPARAGPDDLAVIIANKRYDFAHAVEYADRDGEAMRDFAERVLAIPRDRIIYVPDATLARMRTLFGSATRPGEIAGRLAGRKARRIWVYFSGHGVPGRAAQGGAFEPYLLPKDGSPGQPEHSALPLDEVEGALRAAVAAHARGAQTVLVLDACFSGRAESARGGEAKGSVLSPESSAGGPVRLVPRPASEELIVLAASRDDEIASWDREARHGLFTDLLLQALFNGTGGGRQVTVGSIEAFVAARANERLAALFPGGGRQQRPDLRGRRDVVLVDNAGSITRDEAARRQAMVQCSGLRYSPDAKAIGDFLASPLCARGCDEACRTALGERRRTLEREAAECADLTKGLDALIKARQPKSVLEAALKDVPTRCAEARERVATAIAAIEPPVAPKAVDIPATPKGAAPAPKGSAVEPKWPATVSEPAPRRGRAPDPARLVAPGSRGFFRDTLADGNDCAFCPSMVVVPAGEFAMGSTEIEIKAQIRASKDEQPISERPQHTVSIAKAFAVGQHEVTFAAWDACVEAKGCAHVPDGGGAGRGEQPVANVSWHDAKQFVGWLSKATGKRYRLLTEAEWEYAARAKRKTISQVQINLEAWDAKNSGGTAHPVGEKRENRWGLHDMLGNVSEWVEDCWHGIYTGAPADGSAWLDGACTARVRRGGSFEDGPLQVRATSRIANSPDVRLPTVGFRVAREIEP